MFFILKKYVLTSDLSLHNVPMYSYVSLTHVRVFVTTSLVKLQNASVIPPNSPTSAAL